MKDINNQKLEETIFVDGNPFTNPSIRILQEVYNIDKYEFDKIINGKSNLSEIKNLLFGASIALLINIFAKLIGSKFDSKIIFDNWEVYAFGISLILFLLTSALDYLFPSPNKEIIQKIKSHFKI